MTLGKYINTIEYLDETNKISQSKKKELLLDVIEETLYLMWIRVMI